MHQAHSHGIGSLCMKPRAAAHPVQCRCGPDEHMLALVPILVPPARLAECVFSGFAVSLHVSA
jgi:hypothetical protein